jgi:hypothetical protein
MDSFFISYYRYQYPGVEIENWIKLIIHSNKLLFLLDILYLYQSNLWNSRWRQILNIHFVIE